jgi:hypothetical protein
MSQATDQITRYEIRVRGHINPQWTNWLSCLSIQPTFAADDAPVTILSGELANQSALYGVLLQISDMNLKLISVNSEKGSPKGSK